jgi:AAA domain
VPLADFVTVEEPGSDAILGDAAGALIPEGGDAMLYGDGGVGKTTLSIDLAFHLAAGDPWLGISVPRAVRVLIVENEGPRPLFRTKLGRKLASWTGSELGDRVRVFEEPWGAFTFADERWRQDLAAEIAELAVEVLLVGPVTSCGMTEAGTIQEVRAFLALVEDVRLRSERTLATLLVHHENKGGRVSGAWEGIGDTLLHVQQQGHGHVRLYVQKARWASEQHATTLNLEWAPGDSFALADEGPPRPERVWADIESFVLEHGGCGWNAVDAAVSGQSDYKRRRRDSMLADGLLLNSGRGQRFELWHRDDPARPTLGEPTASEDGRGWDAVASDPGGAAEPGNRVPASPRKGDAVGDAVGSAPPDAPERDDL